MTLCHVPVIIILVISLVEYLQYSHRYCNPPTPITFQMPLLRNIPHQQKGMWDGAFPSP